MLKKQKSLSCYKNINEDKLNQQAKSIENSKKKRRSTVYLEKNFDYYNNYNKTFYVPLLSNPLQIPEEDKIFEERKKYLCYQYENKKPNKNIKKNSVPEDRKVMGLKKLNEKKKKYISADRIKLNYLYMSTNKISRKIRGIKRNKGQKDLNEYQTNLLEVIKPSISDYMFTRLKNKLFSIRNISQKKYQNNINNLKEIEEDERYAINDFNYYCEKCVKTFDRVREEKEMVRYTNLRIKLPLLNFISCIKEDKKIKKRKSKIIK